MTALTDARAALRLPDEVHEVLECLYTPERREQWLNSYALETCRRRRVSMVYILLQEAGYASGR